MSRRIGLFFRFFVPRRTLGDNSMVDGRATHSADIYIARMQVRKGSHS